MDDKTNPGNFFEDFELGQKIVHATPRTVTYGDTSLYSALYGARFAVQSSSAFAQTIGLPDAPVDDLLVFHLVFGKTVPDISLNAIANLGYAQGRFGLPVYAGDTLRAVSEVVGLKQNSNGKTGNVYVRSIGFNQRDEIVLEYIRWVMVRNQNPASASFEPVIPELPPAVATADLVVPASLDLSGYDAVLAGSRHYWEDYETGEKIDHVDAMTIEESDHMTATRLYQNTAKVHLNQYTEKDGRYGRRIVYGGHVISLARCLSFNGLGNAFRIAAINGGRHVAPSFAGDTIYAWSEVLQKQPMPECRDLGALRLRTVATKDQPCDEFRYKNNEGQYASGVVLDFDYTVLIPRKR
jgi:2-methylfumaryl-CoA hydratase